MRKPEIDQDPTIVDVMRADPKIRRVMKLCEAIDAAVAVVNHGPVVFSRGSHD
jgi:hypothetical protein